MQHKAKALHARGVLTNQDQAKQSHGVIANGSGGESLALRERKDTDLHPFLDSIRYRKICNPNRPTLTLNTHPRQRIILRSFAELHALITAEIEKGDSK
jgi:hypothetical protein